ncbi:MAG: protein MPE1, partial [Bacillariaceae sp.]
MNTCIESITSRKKYIQYNKNTPFKYKTNDNIMSSTILYKFRASTTFEALPLPGSAARLFDVKKAIVKANKLDTGSMEFDLAVRNADTNEEYADESMLLPRGTRIIVQRLPAGRGQGFLARMQRNEHGGGGQGNNSFQQQQQQHPSGYYTIDSRARENEEEEFVETDTAESNDDKELAALQAVTSMQADGPTMAGGRSMMGGGGHRGGRGGPQQPAGMGAPPSGSKPNYHLKSNNTNQRPNADPELRDQEKKLMPKKRATGIPRTFLNLSAPPKTDGTKEGEEGDQTPLLQPNKQGFKELVSRGGGQSANTAGTRRDLDYVLKLTSTTVPEHLQCAICENVVKSAMLLPWDTEGRTVCETCIRDALTQNGFRCPLTGMDGVSPD